MRTHVWVNTYCTFEYLCMVCTQTYTREYIDTRVWLFTKFFSLPLTTSPTVVHVINTSHCHGQRCPILESMQIAAFVRIKTVERTFSTGWLRPIGCLKLQVIFHKRATNYRAVLQKMIYEDKASYGSSPPCSGCVAPTLFSMRFRCVVSRYRHMYKTHFTHTMTQGMK